MPGLSDMDDVTKGSERPQPDLPMIDIMVTLGRPSSAELSALNRADKYRILKDNTSARRTELIAWIEDHDLKDEVARVGEPTAFNSLFITCTPRVAGMLATAPGVVKVAPIDDFEVDIGLPGSTE